MSKPVEPAGPPPAPSTPTSEPEAITAAGLARPLPAVVRDDMTIDELAVFLLDHHLSSVAVVGAAGKVVGFVSMTDLVREHVLAVETHEVVLRGHRMIDGFHEAPRHPRVRDIMMPFVLTVKDRSSIAQAAAVMAARDVHRLVVVADDGEPMGLVHAVDVLRWFARQSGAYVADERDEPEPSWRSACQSAH